jgi:uncharacterized membrane protein HdeD (DUF308 family)
MARAGELVRSLVGTLTEHWWVLLARGVVAIAFGVLAIARPGITLSLLVALFGVFALLDGILRSWMAISHRHDRENWGMLLLGGLIAIGIGIITWVAPGLTAFGLVFYIAIWAITTGVVETVAAIRLRHEIEGEWRLLLAGLLSVGFGAILIARPGVGALAVVWLIAAYAIVFGAALVALSLKLHGLTKHLHKRSARGPFSQLRAES